jgi:L-threonylcarbamoyladenylate synthase
MKNYKDSLKSGHIGVIATDTIYGIVGQALNQQTVKRIYNVKKRTPTKPFIILISDLSDLNLFGVTISKNIEVAASRYWPGPVSIILDCPNQRFEYLHRGTSTLAFRMPAKQDLRDILKITGPLVAPSANPEGLTPASTIDEAEGYFGNQVDFYTEGIVNSKPSKIIKITGDTKEIIRA